MKIASGVQRHVNISKDALPDLLLVVEIVGAVLKVFILDNARIVLGRSFEQVSEVLEWGGRSEERSLRLLQDLFGRMVLAQEGAKKGRMEGKIGEGYGREFAIR